MNKYIQVKRNGQIEATMMADAYREYTLQMSTGDFHVHEIIHLNSLPDDVDECEGLLGMYEVRDWAGNLIREAELQTFEEAWDWIYTNIPNPDDSDEAYSDYYVQPRFAGLRLVG